MQTKNALQLVADGWSFTVASLINMKTVLFGVSKLFLVESTLGELWK